MLFGQTLPLEPGRYQFATTFAGRRFNESLFVSPGETTAITFDAAAIAEAVTAEKSAAAEAKKPAEPQTPAEPAKPVSKFCKSCKPPPKAGAKFCTRCGTKVGT